MQTGGFDETQTAYSAGDPRALIGQIRRWGPAGPAYEVIGLDGAGNAEVEVIYSGERIVCPVAEVVEDPLAETIP